MTARMLAVLLGAATTCAVEAQPGAVHRQPLETSDLPGHGLHSVMVRTRIDPGGTVTAHRHPGLELAFVERGGVIVTIDAAAPRTVTAGASFQIAPGTRHIVRNPGAEPAIVVSTYIVDPDLPLATPVP